MQTKKLSPLAKALSTLLLLSCLPYTNSILANLPSIIVSGTKIDTSNKSFVNVNDSDNKVIARARIDKADVEVTDTDSHAASGGNGSETAEHSFLRVDLAADYPEIFLIDLGLSSLYDDASISDDTLTSLNLYQDSNNWCIRLAFGGAGNNFGHPVYTLDNPTTDTWHSDTTEETQYGFLKFFTGYDYNYDESNKKWYQSSIYYVIPIDLTKSPEDADFWGKAHSYTANVDTKREASTVDNRVDQEEGKSENTNSKEANESKGKSENTNSKEANESNS